MDATAIEQVALSKATVRTLPSWADEEDLTSLQNQHAKDSSSTVGSTSAAVGPISAGASNTATIPLSCLPLPPKTVSSSASSNTAPQWSQFATMSHISTISERASRRPALSEDDSTSLLQQEQQGPSIDPHPGSSLRRFPPRLDKLFGGDGKNSSSRNPLKSVGPSPSSTPCVCGCTCPKHRRQSLINNRQSWRIGESTSSLLSRKQSEKRAAREASLGYPTGECVSSLAPPATTWDQLGGEYEKPKDDEEWRFSTYFTNEAFNTDAIKLLLTSPLFSNFLKILTVMDAIAIFAISLNAIVLLNQASDQEHALTQLWNDNVALVVTTIFSLLTILYSCFNFYLDSRRSPEGLNVTRTASKPLTIIFSEILASIAWAQVLSVTIYIYIWTFGCTAAGERQLERLWKEDLQADHRLNARLCRRQGGLLGLELLLILLLVWNFYTHLSQNFQFIRSVSH
ncbi:hypothetical protein BGZ83_005863 [Gryganskiella cystojenkinii]|nr:hypothetical protein BGZ83_005863 [Gryganskiella cystojenkinii]